MGHSGLLASGTTPRPAIIGSDSGSIAPRSLVQKACSDQDPAQLPGPGSRTLQDPVELARRVNVLLAAVAPGMNRDSGLTWVTSFLKGTGHVISSQWWENLLDGVPNPVRRPGVLRSMAENAGIDPRYLTLPDPERDDLVETALHLITSLHETGPGPISQAAVDTTTLGQLTAVLSARTVRGINVP